jgi:hypothetical protein
MYDNGQIVRKLFPDEIAALSGEAAMVQSRQES